MFKSFPASVEAAAVARHGVVTTMELRAGGITRSAQHRRVEAGVLRPLFRGLFAVVGVADPFALVAAIQVRYPKVVAERRTAAAIWDFDDHPPGPWDLARPSTTRIRAAGLPAIRVAEIPDDAVTTHSGLRVTTPAWTLGDLGAAGQGADLVELALESALRRKLTTEAELHAMSNDGPNVLAEALSRRRPGAPPTESYAETRFLQRVVRPLGLEDPERQSPIHIPSHRTTYRADFLFRRRLCLDVEIDGHEGHASPDARDPDSVRDHLIRTHGYGVARFTARGIQRGPSSVQHALRRELESVS